MATVPAIRAGDRFNRRERLASAYVPVSKPSRKKIRRVEINRTSPGVDRLHHDWIKYAESISSVAPIAATDAAVEAEAMRRRHIGIFRSFLASLALAIDGDTTHDLDVFPNQGSSDDSV
jgi:hypothetical protein